MKIKIKYPVIGGGGVQDYKTTEEEKQRNYVPRTYYFKYRLDRNEQERNSATTKYYARYYVWLQNSICRVQNSLEGRTK